MLWSYVSLALTHRCIPPVWWATVWYLYYEVFVHWVVDKFIQDLEFPVAFMITGNRNHRLYLLWKTYIMIRYSAEKKSISCFSNFLLLGHHLIIEVACFDGLTQSGHIDTMELIFALHWPINSVCIYPRAYFEAKIEHYFIAIIDYIVSLIYGGYFFVFVFLWKWYVILFCGWIVYNFSWIFNTLRRAVPWCT